jgi:hypothetical protein
MAYARSNKSPMAVINLETGEPIFLVDPENNPKVKAVYEWLEHNELLPCRYTLDEIREQRNVRLVASDWTQLPDAKVTNLDAWKEYRQALRDITDSYDPTAGVQWPTVPNN